MWNRLDQSMHAVTICLIAITVLATSTRADWPAVHGPTGNYTPKRYGHALVDDLSSARLKWASECQDLGYSKGSVSGYLQNLARWPGHPGSCSGPIVADGKVFVSTFRPTGSVWAQNIAVLKQGKDLGFSDEQTAQLQHNLRIEADDMTVAIDAATGQTLWQAIEAGRGVNRYMGKREGFGPTPAYHDGRVFSIGTTGRLYAYDARNGGKLWETHLGAAFERMEARRKEAIDKHILVDDFGWDASLLVAEGVLVVPLFDDNVDMSLRGVRAKDGATLWEQPAVTSRYATPAVFRHEGRQYLLVANRKGEMRLINPRDGSVLWTVTGLAPNWGPLVTTPSHVFVTVHSSEKAEKKDIPHALAAAYRVSLDGAKHAWTMPDNKAFWYENHMDSCARRRLAVSDGLVYFASGNKAGGTANHFLSILRESDGHVLFHTDALNGRPPLIYPIEDCLLYIPDASHSDRLTVRLFTANPAAFRERGGEWKPPQLTTTAYEVAMDLPFVDGCLYMRTQDGRVTCYDLRRR